MSPYIPLFSQCPVVYQTRKFDFFPVCGLQDAPDHLADLQHLTDLDISNNVNIAIPRGICNLESLVNFIYDGVKDPIVDELNMFTLTRDKQIYLRQER